MIDIRNKVGETVEIFIEGVIGTPEDMQFEGANGRIATYEAFQKQARKIREIDASTVIVNIRSTGGSVSDALLIYDALVALKARVITRCFGYTASAATIIAQAASPGGREISANSLYLVHRSKIEVEGNSEDMTRSARDLAATDAGLVGIYSKRSGRSAASFIELIDENGGNGRWLTPKEALAFGLADKIVDPVKTRNYAADVEVLAYEMMRIINSKKNTKMANKKESWAARAEKFLASLKTGATPKNFVYTDEAGETLFSTASEVDDLAVGMEVELNDDETGGEFELPDGRIVTIVDLIVTEIIEPSDEMEALRTENEALKAQINEAAGIIEGLKAQVGSTYQPAARVRRPTTASRTERKYGAAAANAAKASEDLREAHAAGFARKGIKIAKKVTV